MARALEVVGERWTLLIVREVMCGSTGFRRGIPIIPRDTLARRLRTLASAQLLSKHGQGTETSYELTDAGKALAPLMGELATAIKQQRIRSTGPRQLVRDFPNWFLGYALSSEQGSGAS